MTQEKMQVTKRMECLNGDGQGSGRNGFEVWIWTMSKINPLGWHEISRRDAKCGLGSVNSEFWGEVWAGDDCVEFINAHRHLKQQTTSLSRDAFRFWYRAWHREWLHKCLLNEGHMGRRISEWH